MGTRASTLCRARSAYGGPPGRTGSTSSTSKPRPGVKNLRVEDFVVFVWTTKGEGRVPIHGCGLPDGTDTWFDSDQRLIKSVIDDSFTGFGVKRNAFPSAFYLYEKPDRLKTGGDGAK